MNDDVQFKKDLKTLSEFLSDRLNKWQLWFFIHILAKNRFNTFASVMTMIYVTLFLFVMGKLADISILLSLQSSSDAGGNEWFTTLLHLCLAVVFGFLLSKVLMLISRRAYLARLSMSGVSVLKVKSVLSSLKSNRFRRTEKAINAELAKIEQRCRNESNESYIASMLFFGALNKAL